MTYARTLHSIALFNEQVIAPGLFLAASQDGTRRVHDSKTFRGYAHDQWIAYGR